MYFSERKKIKKLQLASSILTFSKYIQSMSISYQQILGGKGLQKIRAKTMSIYKIDLPTNDNFCFVSF